VKTETIRATLGDLRKAIESIYEHNKDDPEFDVHLTGLLLIDRGDKCDLVALPYIPEKELLISTIRNAIRDMNDAPEPFHGVVIIASGYALDEDTKERKREVVLVALETDCGKIAQLLFDGERTDQGVTCKFNRDIIHENPSPNYLQGNMQGFFMRPESIH